MNKLISCTLGAIFLLYSCVKNTPVPPSSISNNNTPPPVAPTIQAMGGTNQTDTIGKVLLDSVVVKINEPGSALNKFFVQIFQTTLCNGDSVIEKSVTNGSKVSIKWTLNSKPGVQTLNFKILNSQRNLVDSIKVTATALPPTKGWHSSSCIVKNNMYVTAFAKLSTGRILTGFMGDFYPYYSDDNGISWHPIKSFYFGYYPWVEKIAISPTDEIFIGSEMNGVYYSSDKGVTWQARSYGLPTLIPIADLAYTSAGKLIFTGKGGGIYISNDKGLTWQTIVADNSSINFGHGYMATQTNGDIYLTESNNYGTIIVKIDHTTLKVTPVTGLPAITINAFYLDRNNYMYLAGTNKTSSIPEFYRSVDNGISWSKTLALPLTGGNYPPVIGEISAQSDGNYYFVAFGAGNFYKTADFTTAQALPVTIPIYAGKYILAPNNYFLINSYPASICYYVP
jgi:hypothetical protein